MTRALERPHTTADTGRLPRWLFVAIVVGLAVGAATSPAQGLLGDSTRSLANSAGPWSLAAFLVARVSRRAIVAAVLAAVTLATSEIGYVVASQVRGIPSATSTVVFWLVAAALAGPALGVAAAWTRSSNSVLFGGGYGVTAGVLIGEAVYGLTEIRDTTEPAYWYVEALWGAGVLVFIAARRRGREMVAAAVAAALAAAVVYLVATSV